MKFKKINLQSLVVISITLTIAGAAMTQSLYRDMQQSDRSNFSMGTLDLVLSDTNNAVAQSIEITNIGENDSLTGSKTWVVKNNGSLPGKLAVDIENIVNQEHDCNEPEALIDPTCAEPGVGLGELGPAIKIELAMDKGGQEDSLVITDLGPTGQENFRQQWEAHQGKIVLLPGQDVHFILSWEIQDTENSNQIQSDGVSFDVTFVLSQVTKQ